MLPGTADDVELFTALHRTLAELGEIVTPSERRGNRRQAFHCVQLLAPFDGEHMPSQADYTPLLCHDLSPSGFSYLADEPPPTRHLIAALGKTPFMFFVAEIANQRTVQQAGQAKWLIGCRFMRRV